jgi:beta-galactosidase
MNHHPAQLRQPPIRSVCWRDADLAGHSLWVIAMIAFAWLVPALSPLQAGEERFVPPASPHADFNFNPGWKFFRGDATNARQVDFDDSRWTAVSAPHTWNDTDAYDELISHGGGERHEYTGIGWYRKHFKLPASARDGKVFLEFEGLKQAGRFWVNGQYAGKYENGVTPFGLDLTPWVKFGDADNVIAVKVDNSDTYREAASGVGYEWMGRAFNPNYGGLNHDIVLHLTGRIYQTLPLYENLKTTGVYIYPTNFSFAGNSCDVHVLSQVRNESGQAQTITLEGVVTDAGGEACAQFQGDALRLTNGETRIFAARCRLTGAKFWSDASPNLYDVYTMLRVAGTVVDVQKIRTGFRQTAFKGGAGTGGVYLNNRFVWLTGYAQRSSDSWAGLGQAYPDWMHDYNAELIRSTHANYIRWMHVAPQAVDVRACDRAGIIEVCPAGDKEGDPALDKRLKPAVAGRQWEQRMEVMRDTMIYFRNRPSILFWEAGNSVLTPEHMRQMVALRQKWDPHGGRVTGYRGNGDNAANAALTPIAEYYGVMIGQDPHTDALKGDTDMFRAYSARRRDRAPLIECEDFRDEAARRFWDDYSPPHFGFKPGPDDTYHWNSETFCLAAAVRYHDYFRNLITNTDPAHAKWSAYASIYWSDANADGRQDSSEVARVSGKVDAVRLPKPAYYVYRVMQNPLPDLHLIGHWTYPTNTVKTVYVAANHCDSVELFVNGKPAGISRQPCRFIDDFGDTGYIYAFPDVHFAPGELRAVGRVNGKVVARDEIKTAGAPEKLKLTVHAGPQGLQADGADVAFVDVEVVDANGERCPTDESRVDFTLTGPAVWRGGYNSGIPHSINQLHLNTECGINRVAIRSTLQPGEIVLTATRDGLKSAQVELASRPVKILDGLMEETRRRIAAALFPMNRVAASRQSATIWR